MAYTKYSLTPADNNAAPPNGAPEGMLPSSVNDTMRDMMSQIRDVGDGIRDGTYTMTAPIITGGSITGAALSGNIFTNPVITGGSINNTPIGATTANTGKFTTLEATGATTFSGATVMSGSVTANTFSSSGATITGGSINGATIGASTPSTGAFTTSSLKGSTSGVITLNAPAVAGTNTATLPAATGTVMVSGNMPAFSAYNSANQTITSSTWTKVACNTEEFDTANAFDSTTNYRFTPQVVGYYQVNAMVTANGSGTTAACSAIYKNGSATKYGAFVTSTSPGCPASAIVFLNGSTDYIEMYAYIVAATPSVGGGGALSYFQASLVRTS